MIAKDPKFWGIIGAVIGLLGGLADSANLWIEVFITAGISYGIWYVVAVAIVSIIRKGKL